MTVCTLSDLRNLKQQKFLSYVRLQIMRGGGSEEHINRYAKLQRMGYLHRAVTTVSYYGLSNEIFDSLMMTGGP